MTIGTPDYDRFALMIARIFATLNKLELLDDESFRAIITY